MGAKVDLIREYSAVFLEKLKLMLDQKSGYYIYGENLKFPGKEIC